MAAWIVVVMLLLLLLLVVILPTQDNEGLNELEFELGQFLRPLGLEEFVQQFAECGCHRVRDVMAFTDRDLQNLGVADASRRKLLLHRLSSM